MERMLRGRGNVLLRIGVIAGALAVGPLLYRSIVVYEWRPGRCRLATETPVVLPGAPTTRADGRAIRIATWNISGHSSLTDPAHLEKVARQIRTLDADVIALQEVHRGTWQSRFEDQAAVLVAATSLHGIYAPSFRTPEGDYGNMILTRGEIIDRARLDLPGIGEPRSVLLTTLRFGQTTIRAASTHLSAWGPLNRRWRLAQCECIEQSLPAGTLLAGDLNVGPEGPELAPLFRAGARDVDASLSPTHAILESKLDYILTPPSWRVDDVRLLSSEVSDHRPLAADVVPGE